MFLEIFLFAPHLSRESSAEKHPCLRQFITWNSSEEWQRSQILEPVWPAGHYNAPQLCPHRQVSPANKYFLLRILALECQLWTLLHLDIMLYQIYHIYNTFLNKKVPTYSFLNYNLYFIFFLIRDFFNR